MLNHIWWRFFARRGAICYFVLIVLFFTCFLRVAVIALTDYTNVLNSHFLYKLLEIVGVVGCGLLPAGIPVGIIGIIMSKRMEQLRKSTLILSIVNLSVGSIEILMLLVLFGAVVFGGASV